MDRSIGIFSPAFSDEATSVTADAPVDARLLRMVPPPVILDFGQLEQEVARQRRIVVRGDAGIPIVAVIAVGGALLIHAMLVGIFVLSFYFVARTPAGMGGVHDGDSERGGVGAGYMFMGDDQDKEVALKSALANAAPALPPTPVATPTPAATPPVEKIAVATPPAIPAPAPVNPVSLPPDASVIGVPSGDEMVGEVHPVKAVPVATTPTPSPTVGLPIAAPSPTVLATPVNTSIGPNVVASAAGVGNHAPVHPGLDDGTGDDDEGTISLLRSGAGGDETGSGKHRGNGIDRGIFDGQKEPGVLDAPAFSLWADYQFHPPKKPVSVTVKILASGAIGSVVISKSCGIPDIDEAYKEHVLRKYRFSPAYRGGTPSDGTIECSQSFTSDNQ